MIRQRLITAVIAAIILLLVLFMVPTQLARYVIVGLFVIAAWEWSGFLGVQKPTRLVFVALIVLLILPALLRPELMVARETVFMIAAAWWVAALLWTFFYPTPIPGPVAWFGGILVLVPAYIALDWLYQLVPAMLLFMLLIVLAADIGAFFAGRGFGKVKLAPSISPGKTWEGALGGMTAVTLLTIIESLVLGFPLLKVLPLALAVGSISIVGDLTVSMFKRHAGLKDAGRLFPGHGGFLDRADSITAAAPIFCLGITWLGTAILGLPAW